MTRGERLVGAGAAVAVVAGLVAWTGERRIDVESVAPSAALVRSIEQSLREPPGDSLVGAAVCFDLGGGGLLEAGFGWARAPYEEVAPGVPMTGYSVVPGASTGKSVNAATLLTVLHRRGLDAGARVVDLFPPDYVSYGPNIDQMTVAHLLSHTSGFDFRDAYYYEAVEDRIKEVLEGGSERPPGGDPTAGLWTAGQGPPPSDWKGSVYSNINYFLVRVLTEHLTGIPFEDAVEAIVLRPAGLPWSPEAEPEPRTLGYSRWRQGAPGSRRPESFRGHAGPAGWHTSACGLADATWALFGSDLLPPDVRRGMLTEQMGIMTARERGLPIWIHSGVWTPNGQGFELGMGFFPGGVTGGFTTNTWANVKGSRVLRRIWREHTPEVGVEAAGPGVVRLEARYERIPGTELRWTMDPGTPLVGAPVLRGYVEVPATGTVRVAAFLDRRWASLPIEVPLNDAPTDS